MRFSLLFFLALLGVLSLCLAQGSYEDCCLNYVKEVSLSTKKRVVGYRRQEQDGGCNIRAIVFQMKRDCHVFCARPGDKWVKELMEETDKKRPKKHLKKCTKHIKRG